MRRALAAALALGCQGTSGGILPDARSHDAAIDPCLDPGDWAIREARIVAAFAEAPAALAVDDSFAYLGGPGPVVERAPLAGGDADILFDGGDPAGAVAALGATRAYVFAAIGDQLWRVPKDGMEADVVAAAAPFAADADAVYFFEGGELVRLAADSLERTPVGAWQGAGSELQLVDETIWWLEPEPVTVWRMKLLAGLAEPAARLDQALSAGALAVARADQAFVVSGAGADGGGLPTLYRVGLEDGSAEPLAELADGGAALEADAAHVYWIEPAVKRLSRLPVDGGCVESRDQEAASGLMAMAPEGILVVAAGNLALVER